MNVSDSERIATYLEKEGYKPGSKKEEADLLMVNMCSVRQSAVDRVFGVSRNFDALRIKKPKLKTVLTGCILKSNRKLFKEKFDEILDKKTFLNLRPKYKDKKLAYIPISNGCNNFCTYCVVPYTRGPLKCFSHKKILNEAKSAIRKGCKEIWLLGQNVNDYHSEQITNNRKQVINFSKLLELINKLPGDFKIRFMSPNPKNFSDELIDAMANCEKVAKFLNLPVQSGDNKILKAMNRPYTRKQYKKLVQKIREKIPDINLTTDVIVGFPGETKRQFENTLKLFKDIKFNLAYVAKYSPRKGTAAFKLKDNILLEEKKRREKILKKVIADNAPK